MGWLQLRPKEIESTDGYATTQMQARAIFPRNDQLLKKTISRNCRSLETAMKTHIIEVRGVMK